MFRGLSKDGGPATRDHAASVSIDSLKVDIVGSDSGVWNLLTRHADSLTATHRASLGSSSPRSTYSVKQQRSSCSVAKQQWSAVLRLLISCKKWRQRRTNGDKVCTNCGPSAGGEGYASLTKGKQKVIEEHSPLRLRASPPLPSSPHPLLPFSSTPVSRTIWRQRKTSGDKVCTNCGPSAGGEGYASLTNGKQKVIEEHSPLRLRASPPLPSSPHPLLPFSSTPVSRTIWRQRKTSGDKVCTNCGPSAGGEGYASLTNGKQKVIEEHSPLRLRASPPLLSPPPSSLLLPSPPPPLPTPPLPSFPPHFGALLGAGPFPFSCWPTLLWQVVEWEGPRGMSGADLVQADTFSTRPLSTQHVCAKHKALQFHVRYGVKERQVATKCVQTAGQVQEEEGTLHLQKENKR